MQATDTANSQDFARKAATVARWTGRALWFVFGSIARVVYALTLGIFTFVVAFSESDKRDEPMVSLFGVGPGPAPGEPGHNHTRWTDYYLGED